MTYLSVEEIRRLEKSAAEHGLSYLQMMKNAGERCADEIENILGSPDKLSGYVCVLAGNGRNAGDGFVIAKKLQQDGYKVSVFLFFGEPSDEVTRLVYFEMLGVGIAPVEIQTCADFENVLQKSICFVDAVFGIGFHGSLGDEIRKIFRLCNSKNAMKISIDVPSGLDVQNRTRDEACFSPDTVLTMIAPKRGLENYNTKVMDIGVSLCKFNENLPDLPPRPANSHKGTFGSCLIFAGSYSMPGAAVFASNAAVRSGVGLVTAAFPDSAYNAITPKITEPVLLPLSGTKEEIAEILIAKSKNSTVLAAGPGLGVNENNKYIVENLIKFAECPIILDADALNLIADNTDILLERKNDLLITPHPGEFSRLINIKISEINKNRCELARKFAERYKITVLLKGQNTVICSSGEPDFINETGCSGLAKGGSGDVLTGLIAGFAAQNKNLHKSAILGAFIHGLAGEIASENLTEYACTPSDVIENIGKAIAKYMKKN